MHDVKVGSRKYHVIVEQQKRKTRVFSLSSKSYIWTSTKVLGRKTRPSASDNRCKLYPP